MISRLFDTIKPIDGRRVLPFSAFLSFLLLLVQCCVLMLSLFRLGLGCHVGETLCAFDSLSRHNHTLSSSPSSTPSLRLFVHLSKAKYCYQKYFLHSQKIKSCFFFNVVLAVLFCLDLFFKTGISVYPWISWNLLWRPGRLASDLEIHLLLPPNC